ncbi:MAG: hypothetical protein AB1499_00130 [Nitrospirota bacterium]
MSLCKHSILALLPEKKNLRRCRLCHLTIKADELGEGHCPECFETRGERKYDFEEVVSADTGKARYRCEECGVIIESH